MPETGPTKVVRRRLPWLPRGETPFAFTGLAMAGVLVLAIGASAYWTGRTHRQYRRADRTCEVEGAAAVTGAAIAHTLADGDTAGARLFLMDAAREHRLSRAVLTLPDGTQLADADAGPEAPGGIVVTRTLPMPDGKDATLEFRAASMGSEGTWYAVAGVAGVGAVALGGVLLVYRRTRSRLMAMGLICEALRALNAGEKDPEALVVGESFGSEAHAWNALLRERQRLEQEARSDRARTALGEFRRDGADLASACDALWHGLMIIDAKMRVTYANGVSAAFLGVKREALVGADACTLVKDEATVSAIGAVVGGTVRRRITVEARAAGENDAVLRFSVRPVRRDDTAAAMVLIEDVTQQRIADEARNSFVAQATHELRTPLTNIRLYVEQAVDDDGKDPQVRARSLNVINQEARRLERIVGDMLSVSEIEAGSLKLRVGDVRLQPLFEELSQDFSPQATEKKIQLTFNLPPKLPVIQGDRDKIVLAIHNLIGNALKYTPEGGRVDVNVTEEQNRLVVGVADTGIGISGDEVERVFEKFYRAKDKRIVNITGSGLGLALAREVVRLHGGDITCDSQIDKGSTFTLTVPSLAQAA